MTQPDHGKNKSQKQPDREKERRELIRGVLLDILWFSLDLGFVWPISHVWAVALGAVAIAIHLLTSSWTIRNKSIYCVMLLLCTAFIIIYVIPPNETDLHGYLTPANDPFPSGPCPMAQYGTQEAYIYFGGNEAKIPMRTTVAVFSVSGRPTIEFRLTDKGLMVAGEIYTKSGEVAWIFNNEFWLNPNLQFRSVHPDQHTLVVRDNMGTEALSIRYLNKRAVRFTGRLCLPDGNRVMVITEDSASISPTGQGSFLSCYDYVDSTVGTYSLLDFDPNTGHLHIGPSGRY